MGCEIDAIRCYSAQVLLYGAEVCVWLSHLVCRRSGVKYSTSYPAMLSETSARPIDVLGHAKTIQVCQENQEYVWSSLPKQVWNTRCMVPITNESKILLYGEVLNIMKLFKRWGLKDI